MPAADDRLLIKVILPKQGWQRRVKGGPQSLKPLRDVTPEFRASLATRVSTLRVAIAAPAKEIGAAPARVRLVSNAIAKTHRPEKLFSQDTCPIVGVGTLGDLYIKATPKGLRELENQLTSGTSDRLVKEISTIETIEPITPEDRRHRVASADILRTSPRISSGYATRVQLFDFGSTVPQHRLQEDFLKRAAEAGVEIDRAGYSDDSQCYQAICQTTRHVDELTRIIGVRSVTRMPVMQTIRSLRVPYGAVPKDLPTPGAHLTTYPIVAVVDSGIASNTPALGRWIVGSESTVAVPYRNPSHGTFVAGLVALGPQFNNHLDNIDASPCAVFDLQVIPNGDPAFGDVDELLESQFLEDLETALAAHANEIRVWNLSLGTNEVCALDQFSAFAIELDRLQEKYNVTFVISAGNYEGRPLLAYPRATDQLSAGRLTTPADSVLAVTVGSVAHVTHEKTGPKRGEPSAFSRHGAGPNYIIKPDVVHFGGTCCQDGTDVRGVRSISNDGIEEALGTSFAAPLVSRTLANIFHSITPTPSRELARALLTHHSRDARTGERVPDTEENYVGFGLPATSEQSLQCSPWATTLVFEDTIRAGWYLEWDHFPWPDSLRRNGRYFGDIWMTLAFTPMRDARWGSEYCETHIDAKFGVYRTVTNRKTGKTSQKFEGKVPPEHQNTGELWETFQVQHLRKWAPVRTFFGSLGPRGVKGERWRLKLQLLCRHHIEDSELFPPQPFALVLTIADPNRSPHIYNEMAVKIHNKYKAQNLTLRAAARIKTQERR